MSYAFTLSTPTGNLKSLTVTPAAANRSQPNTPTSPPAPSAPSPPPPSPQRHRRQTTLSAQLELNARRAEWNTGATKNWSTPKGYTRIKAADILKIVTKMAN